MRLTTTAIPVCFFIALAMWKLILLAKKAYAGLPSTVLFSIGVLLFSYISLKTYFVDFTPKRIYGGQHAELATETAPLFNELKSTNSFYFFGPPHMYWGFSTIPYLVPGADAEDIMEPITAPPSRDILISENGAVFVFVPERVEELQLVEQAFPGGDRFEIVRAYDGRMLASIYHVQSP
jgi:hypothetical protein